jgi:hypothetical protein
VNAAELERLHAFALDLSLGDRSPIEGLGVGAALAGVTLADHAGQAFAVTDRAAQAFADAAELLVWLTQSPADRAAELPIPPASAFRAAGRALLIATAAYQTALADAASWRQVLDAGAGWTLSYPEP